MIYIISDTHFRHKKILEFERYQFATIEEHDKYIIEKLEKVLTKYDILYHLGDFGFFNSNDEFSNKLLKRWDALPCKKILIKGNHDKENDDFYKTHFDEVYNHPLYLNTRVILSHYPLPVTQGTLNIHGHLHDSYLKNLNNYMNANIHMLNYNPIDEKAIEKVISKLTNDSMKFLSEWYIDQQVFRNTNKEGIVFNKNGTINLEETKKKQGR